jgi:predicted RNA-binding protein with PUA-like domain
MEATSNEAQQLRRAYEHSGSAETNMQTQPRQYWALNANPDNYRIEDAATQVEFDNWVTKGSEIHEGDRAIIWKAKGHSKTTGIVALAAIIADPGIAPDLHPEYQQYASPPHHSGPIEEMVTLRYVLAPNLPLWLDGPHHDLLSSLNIVRGNARRSVYRIEPDQWMAILEAAGGWPDEGSDVQAIEKLIDQGVGSRRGGQGFQADSAVRQAVERHAMQLAMRHYQQQGWKVEDVSAKESYDLHCRNAGGQELRVEVKGTTGQGSQVLLTAGEVTHARSHYPRVALYIVSNIRVSLSSEGIAQPHGGDVRVFEPWKVEPGSLTPLTYSYRVS